MRLQNARAVQALACAALFVAGIGLFAALAGSTPATAQSRDRPQNVGRDIVGQSYDQIIERGYIVIGAYEDFPPFSWAENGKPRGIDIEIGRLIAEDLDVEPRFRLVGADETVDDDLRNHVWRGSTVGGAVVNVLMHVPWSEEFAHRNDLSVITGQYFQETMAIAYRADAYPDGAPTPAYFRYDTVGVETDSLAAFYLANLANGQLRANMRHHPSNQAAMTALATGAVKAVMGPRTELEFGAKDHDGIAVHTPPMPGLSIGTWTLGVAVRHTWRQLGYAVDDAIRAAIDDGRMAAIFAEHAVTYTPPAW